MATTKITDLTAYTDPVNTDVLPIVDVTSDVTKKVSIANVMKNASQGTAAAPGIAFDGDSNTGVYSPGADQVAVTTGGTQRLLIDSAGAVTIAGDLTVNGTTTNINTQNLIVEDKNIVLGDVAVPTDVTADGGGITLKGTTDKTINWVDATDAWTSSERFSYPTGSAAAPTLTFTGDSNTGIYSPGADQVSVATGGTERLRIDSTGQIEAVSLGTAAAPTFTFTGDPDTGVYSPGANQLAISTNGTRRFQVSSDGTINVFGANKTPSGGGNSVIYATDTQAVDVGGSIAFGGYYIGTSSDTEWAQIAGRKENSTSGNYAGYLQFSTRANGGSTTERLRITSAGLVGVGTSTPQLSIGAVGGNVLHLAGAGTTGLRVQNTSGNSVDIYAGTDGFINQSGSGTLNFQLAGSTKATLTSTGLGIGSSSPGAPLEVAGASSANISVFRTNDATAANNAGGGFYGISSATAGSRLAQFWLDADGANFSGGDYFYISKSGNNGIVEIIQQSNAAMGFHTNGTRAVTIDSSQRVGIGSTPSFKLDVNTGSNDRIRIVDSASATLELERTGAKSYLIQSTGDSGLRVYDEDAGSERLRVDTSGRLLVGTSSARANMFNSVATSTLQLEAVSATTGAGRLSAVYNDNSADGTSIILGKSRATTVGGSTAVQSGDALGSLSWQGADGSELVEAAFIRAEVDGTPGANDMPGRLVFSTTADGASSPTEAMRIAQDRGVSIGGVSGAMVSSGGFLYVQRQSATAAFFNRNTDDGTIIDFRQDNVSEGTISVSGTTVQLNGAHLSRWSQLPGGAQRTEILRGSILSNLDEMCEWGDEDNEQLNRTKISDVEGDKNVAGVFVAWDDDDDTYTNDFYCAMTGDFIIRIGAGVTVERGDLLMSAGDGTAKPQDDDIIRSKTIAKVTSTNVSCTYDDGSYCVPCVLMAC